MRKAVSAVAALAIIVGTVWTVAFAQEKDKEEKDGDKDKKPKYTIKDVMKKAHKGPDALLKKVESGKASKDEMKELVTMYKSLEMNKPPKGEEAAWKKRTKALVAAANAAIEEKKDASDLLKKATNCKNCHDAHKGK